MIFTFIENTAYVEKHEKYIKVEHKNQSSVKNLVDELESMKIYNKLSQNINESPEDNYNRFAHLVNSARKKHLSTKIVKYNKKKHKKIMLDGLWDFRIYNQQKLNYIKDLYKQIKITLNSLTL